MPLNLPQSFMTGSYGESGKTLVSPSRTFSGMDASKAVAGIKRGAAALAMQTYKVLQLPPLCTSGTSSAALMPDPCQVLSCS